MNKAFDKLRDILNDVDTKADNLKVKLKDELNLLRPLIITPYMGYCNGKSCFLYGRVLEENGLAQDIIGDKTSVFTNAMSMLKRFSSDEIPFIKVRVTFEGQSVIVEADEEGHIQAEIQLNALYEPEMTHFSNVHYELVENPFTDQETVEAHGQVVVVGKNADMAVISDIDDTVIKSKATAMLEMFRIALKHNAANREVFDQVPQVYQALHYQPKPHPANPFFYVSSSPWNIYDLLSELLRLREIPKGPLFLQDLGLNDEYWVKAHHKFHKQAHIENIMKNFPSLPFILIGDSGQRDIHIYTDVAQKNPEQVRAIFIRKVVEDDQSVLLREHREKLKGLNVPLHFFDDTVEIMQFAEEHNWINSPATSND